MNIAIFAGGFTFGTLLILPNTIDNFDYIRRLLSFAFIMFASSLFAAIALQYLLREYNPASEAPCGVMSIICQAHTYATIVLIIVGVLILNIVLLAVGQKPAGIIGIILLSLIPVWYGCIWYLESRDRLGNPVPISSDVNESQVSNEKLC